MLTLLLFWLATARSRLPSPSKSAATTKRGAVPTAKLTGRWKEPSPLPSSTLTVLAEKLVQARSAMPSPLKSPAVSEWGVRPAPPRLDGAWKVPSPLPRKRLTLLSQLTAATSRLPSPLKSATARTRVFGPVVAYVTGSWKEPSPLPRKTLMLPLRPVLKLELAVARSGMPSPLKSATTVPKGTVPPVSKLPEKVKLGRLRSSKGVKVGVKRRVGLLVRTPRRRRGHTESNNMPSSFNRRPVRQPSTAKSTNHTAKPGNCGSIPQQARQRTPFNGGQGRGDWVVA